MKILCLVLISIPLISLAGILWEDNFDSYREGSRLLQTGKWGVWRYYDNAKICKDPLNNGLAVRVLSMSCYYAKAGSMNPNMKVSISIDDMADHGTGYFGLTTRFSDSNWYMLLCEKDHASKMILSAEIYYFNGGNWNLLAKKEINKEIKTISLKAEGRNPVNITAYLDDILIETIDSYYMPERGYGGIIYDGCCMCSPYFILDDFVEEGDPSDKVNIDTTSFGNIKALFK
jgi:hypothetical protein